MQVLSLDGLSVTAEVVHDILIDPSYSVRILSIREVQHMNERKLRGALQYACRASRPEGMPRLKGLYLFGHKDTALASAPIGASRSPSPTSPGRSPIAAWNSQNQKAPAVPPADEPEAWYVRPGSQFSRRISSEWASTLVACAGIISFDSVLCRGPRHFNSPAWGTVNIEALDAAASAATSVPHFGVATHSLGGCASCGVAPEGWTVWGEEELTSQRDAYGRRTSETSMTDLARFPLLAPPPMHSAGLRVAMCPTGQTVKSRLPFIPKGKQERARFIPRCFDCIRDRYCGGCHKWWCESCYLGPRASSPAGHGASHAGPDSVSSPLPSTSVVSVDDDAGAACKIRDGVCADGKCSLQRP